MLKFIKQADRLKIKKRSARFVWAKALSRRKNIPELEMYSENWEPFHIRQQRARGAIPATFIYDDLPERLRIQIFYIIMGGKEKRKYYYFGEFGGVFL